MILLLILHLGINARGFMGTEQAISFVENLRISAETDERFVWFGSKTMLWVDEKGNMYVSTANDGLIQVFDKNGVYLTNIGQKGQGPGEFQNLSGFFMLPKGGIAHENVMGHCQLVHFDNNYKYVKSETCAQFYTGLTYSPDGRYFAATVSENVSDNPPDGKYLRYKVFAADGKVLHSLSEVLDKPKSILVNGRPAWERLLARQMKVSMADWGRVAFVGDGSYYTAVQNRYEIIRWNKNHEKQYTIAHQYTPVMRKIDEAMRQEFISDKQANWNKLFNEKVFQEAVVLAELSPGLSPVLGMVALENGHLLVIRNVEPKNTWGDVFSPTGSFIGKTVLPNISLNTIGGKQDASKLIFRNGMAYALEVDGSGEYALVRFSYKINVKP